MSRILTISVALAAFIAVPSLCVGGVIMHACECAAVSDCACERNCEQETECGHESGCSDDPCSVPVVSRREARTDWSETAQLPPLILEPAAGYAPSLAPRVGALLLESPCRRNVAFPAGDLPLLI